MTEREIRKQLVAHCKYLSMRGYSPGTRVTSVFALKTDS